MNHWR